LGEHAGSLKPLARRSCRSSLLSSIRTIPSAPASHRICWPFRRSGRRSRARRLVSIPPVGNCTPPWERLDY